MNFLEKSFKSLRSLKQITAGHVTSQELSWKLSEQPIGKISDGARQRPQTKCRDQSHT